MTDKYRIKQDFVVPEPTAARHFAMISEEDFQAGEADRIFEEWKSDGVKQARLTLVNDEYLHEPYPHGVWLEGWTDAATRQLPFGEAEIEGGPCWPPLVDKDSGNLRAGNRP